MSKLERRLTFLFVGVWSNGSGRGEGGGEELEVLRDMGIRGAS